jgi:hypothetical protein
MKARRSDQVASGAVLVAAVSYAIAIALRPESTAHLLARAAVGIALLVAPVTLVFAGSRLLRRERLTLANAMRPSLGFLLTIAICAFVHYSLDLFAQTDTLVGESALQEALARTDPIIADLSRPIEKRALASRMRAAAIFTARGEIVEVIAEDGTSIPYEPSESDLHLRREVTSAGPVFERASNLLRNYRRAVVVSVLAALACGLLLPNSERVAPPAA